MAEINEKVEKILINTDNNSLIFEPSEGGDTSDAISLWDQYPTDGGTSGTLMDAIVPEGVVGIKKFIFDQSYLGSGIRYLKSLSLPSTLTSINDYAFRYQSQLIDLLCSEGEDIAIMPGAFNGASRLTTISSEFWDRVSSIGASVFAGCSAIGTASIGKTVSAIGNSAFEDCTGLTAVTCTSTEDATALTIGNYAFRRCTALTSVELPARASSISSSAFNGCTNLTTITIHKAQDSISGAPWGATNATVVWDG
jgi:hypothetical protein